MKIVRWFMHTRSRRSKKRNWEGNDNDFGKARRGMKKEGWDISLERLMTGTIDDA